MAEFPYMPLWTDAYLADTRHLTTEEHGAYILLLIEAWRRPNCSLPDDDKLLSRLAGLGPDQWAEIKDTVLAFWERDGRSKTWTQKRLFSEREKSAQKSRSASDNARKRWNKKKKNGAGAMPNGYQKDAIQNQNNPPTPQGGIEYLKLLGARIQKSPGENYLFTNVTSAQCREMLAAEIVTQDQLRAVGLSA